MRLVGTKVIAASEKSGKYHDLAKKTKCVEMRNTVMLSIVEMPRVIFSPDSAGMRKTNLRDGKMSITTTAYMAETNGTKLQRLASHC